MNSHMPNLVSVSTNELKLRGFKVYRTDSSLGGFSYSRKDFYKINITTGRFLFNYSDKSIETEENFLFFGNPHIPYSCEARSEDHHGYTCLFTEDFMNLNERSASLQHSPLFKFGGTPIFGLNETQKNKLAGLFEEMIT